MNSMLNSSLVTPSGLVFPNRLIKAAMSEEMSSESLPGDKYLVAYTTWASGGWGGLITGNVDVSTRYRAGTETIAAKLGNSQAERDAWTLWAQTCQKNGTPTLVQLVHPGRQSPAAAGDRGFFEPNIAPSPIPMNIGASLLDRGISRFVFGTPKEMTCADIEEVIRQFTAAAKLAYESGFNGIQLHAAHGYLLCQFLSPTSNIRIDAYGGTAARRARILIEIIRAIRAVVPNTFCIGIKLNSADVKGAENLEESLEQVALIAAEQIDFLEISGGSLENPRMATGDDSPALMRTTKREAFFLDYARAVRERYPRLLLMVTGGFRTRKGMESALNNGFCDLLGLGRPSAAWPHLPKDIILNASVQDEDAQVHLSVNQPPWLLKLIPLKLIGFGADVMYYSRQIHTMGEGKIPQPPPES